MYQVLIVDDEYLVRNKMECAVNWGKYGFCVVDSVSDGNEAIDFMNSNNIDVVFTDVYMPSMDGIELSKYIKEHFPHTIVVVMSSYSDFNYVRECFMSGAYDYILKHTITEEFLENLLQKLKNCLSGTSNKNNDTYERYIRSQKYRESIINSICGASPAENDIPKGLIAVAKINHSTMLNQLNTADELKMFYQNIINTIAQILKSLPGFIVFQNSHEHFIMFMPFPTTPETAVITELKNYIRQISYSVRKFFDLNLLWGFSCMSSQDYSLKECYKEAINMLSLMPVKDKTEQKSEFEFTSLSIKHEKKLISAIQTLNYIDIDKALIEIFDNLPANNFAANIIAGELMTIANKICDEYNINIDTISQNLIKLSFITKGEYLSEEIFNWSKKLFHCIVDEYNAHSNVSHKQRYSPLVHDFISKNYSEDITLKDIAASVGITESHLSTVFRAETGETISGYLTTYRIEKSKELLEKDFDIKYLYSNVGFKNYNYFFVAFKKCVGCTPIQYKKNHMRNKK